MTQVRRPEMQGILRDVLASLQSVKIKCSV